MSDQENKPEQNPATIIPVALLVVLVELLAELKAKDPDLVQRVFDRLKRAQTSPIGEGHAKSMELVEVIIRDLKNRP